VWVTGEEKVRGRSALRSWLAASMRVGTGGRLRRRMEMSRADANPGEEKGETCRHPFPRARGRENGGQLLEPRMIRAKKQPVTRSRRAGEQREPQSWDGGRFVEMSAWAWDVTHPTGARRTRAEPSASQSGPIHEDPHDSSAHPPPPLRCPVVPLSDRTSRAGTADA